MNSTPLPHPLTLVISLVAACSGAAALFTFFSLYSALPLRMDRVERLNESQDARIAEIQQDAAQRREMLAVAIATLQQIDQRTKRIEDKLLK
jgi:C4-dicarboxylate-specific signal transduction histidine kinase